ncbi:MAG: hypothetical protein SVS15_00480 [Thermodesulfobacteriota bacterium]|nr:hypothetical protein [Thermodesulfobacteriota bacterium]
MPAKTRPTVQGRFVAAGMKFLTFGVFAKCGFSVPLSRMFCYFLENRIRKAEQIRIGLKKITFRKPFRALPLMFRKKGERP